MAKKKLSNSVVTVQEKDDEWKKETISFVYRDKSYRAKIEGHLVLNDMSLIEIKDRLNDIPGKFAFWKSLQVTVDREVEDLAEDYELWFAKKYQEIVEDVGKKLTETAIKNFVLLDNAGEYREQRLKIKDLKNISMRIGILTKSYDMQLWTLRSIASLTEKEMGSIEAYGKRSLKDI